MKMINKHRHLELENQRLRASRMRQVKGAAAVGVATGVVLTTVVSKAITKFPKDAVKSRVNERIEFIKQKLPLRHEEYDLLDERDDYDYINTHVD